MKKEWVKYLCDPTDGSELRVAQVSRSEDNRIVDGKLSSANGNTYNICDGIPVFLSSKMQSTESVSSFAYEWNEFGFLYAKSGWETDIVNPLVKSTKFFKDKIVVDAGAGSGAQSRWMAEAGAKLVICLELSDGIFTAVRNSIEPYKDTIFPIQCDIASPPISLKPDLVYCVNVLQHTANPRETFSRLAKLLGKESFFLFNIYLRRSEAAFLFVRAVRRAIRLLPFSVWKWLSFSIVTVAYPLSKVHFLRRPIQRLIPISHSFRETWLDVYDAYGGHFYQENMTRSEQLRMIAESKLRITKESKFGYLLTLSQQQ